MNWRRIGILVHPHLLELLHAPSFLGLYLLGLGLATVPIGWDGTHVTVFGWSIEVYTAEETREAALMVVLRELFSWGWLITLGCYFLPRLLRPLAESFAVSHLLWLRLTPCLPREVACARVVRVLSAGLWVGCVGSGWVGIVALFHNVEPSALRLNVEGVVSHLLLAGGLVVVLGSILPYRQASWRWLVPLVAVCTPVVLFLVYAGVRRLWVSPYTRFWPYAGPFADGLEAPEFHFRVTALVGLLLLLGHIGTQHGKCIEPTNMTGQAHKEIS